MKKFLFILLLVLLLLQMLEPGCFVVTLCTGLELQAYHPEVFASVTAALMLISAVFAWRCKGIQSKFYNIISYFLLPVSIINGLLWFIEMSVYMIIIAVLNCLCSIVIFYFSAGGWKWLVEILSGLLSLLLLLALGLAMFVDAVMPSVSVIEEYPSPDGTYTAQVEVLDGGARGASTKVYLYNHSWDVVLPIGRLGLPEEEIYSGEWLDYKTLTVRWLDEDTLVINGEIYYEVE